MLKNRNFPPNAFLDLTQDQRTQLEQHLYTTSYAHPELCSISGFKINENGMQAIFKRHDAHIKGLCAISGDSNDQVPQRKPRYNLSKSENKE